MTTLWAAATWRATANAMAGLLAALAGVLLLGALAVPWLAAIISLADWSVGGWGNAALYIAAVIVIPVLKPWVTQGLTALQRARLRATLGTDIPAPPRTARRAPWPVGPWLAPGTRRQLGFHLLAGPGGRGRLPGRLRRHAGCLAALRGEPSCSPRRGRPGR